MRGGTALRAISRKSGERNTVGSIISSEKGRLLFGQDVKKEVTTAPLVTDPKLDNAVAKLLHRKDSFDLQHCALVVRQCGHVRALDHGKRVHQYMEKCGDPSASVFLSNLLVQMYGKCGDVDSARRVFDAMKSRNAFTWSLMLSAYARSGRGPEALELFREISSREGVEFDDVLLATLLGICARVGDLQTGREVHARAKTLNLVSRTALVFMYAKCGAIAEARAGFDAMEERDVKAWNVMISAYTANGAHAEDALQLYKDMEKQQVDGGVRPDAFTFSAALAACASLGDLEEGKEIHDRILRRALVQDLALQNALVNMYAKCGSVGDAHRLFDLMEVRDVISWTCLIGGYVQNGEYRQALGLYKRMLFPRPNSITYANALSAVAGLGDLAEGVAIHERMLKEGYDMGNVAGCALINMYARCSCLERAKAVFDGLQLKDEACGNAMLAAYAQFGRLADCEVVVKEMVHHGSRIGVVTLVCLLLGCSHAGRVEDGRTYFLELVGEQFVEPVVDHYMCLVDLLGRAGRLAECEELVQHMPFDPQPLAWITLLAACKVHGDVARGERAAAKVDQLEPGSANYRVLMSSVLAMTRTKEAKTILSDS